MKNIKLVFRALNLNLVKLSLSDGKTKEYIEQL